MLPLMTAGGFALVVAIAGTPLIMRSLTRRRIGQHIHEDVVQHSAKAGTPTMGGLAIVLAAVGGYLLAHVFKAVYFSRGGFLVMVTIAGFAFVGFLDDAIKVRNRRSLGLNKRAKMAGLIGVSLLVAELAVHWAHTSTTVYVVSSAKAGLHLGQVPWVIFAVVVLVAASNAVNLTDGLDGLAAGSATLCFSVLAIIGYWIYRHVTIYHVPATVGLDMALCAVALAGACLGFLWWNAAPAQIIMGDTGSLALGSGLAAVCLLLNLDLLLIVIGGLFVLETLSVIAQVVSYRLFRRRVFRMAPIHHHFELLGWPETTVIIRFWILAGLFAALGLGLFYAEFLNVDRFT